MSGLYDPRFEHDACGLGFVASLGRAPTHEVVERGLEVLRRLAHRGAAGCDPLTGDGAGILLQIPHAFYERALARQDMELPLPGDYGVAFCFLSREPSRRASQMRTLEAAVRYHNQKVIGWRDVPVDPRAVGPVAKASMPTMRQLFVARMCAADAFERTLFMIRKRAGRLASAAGHGDDFYVASCSAKTVVYKGLMLPERVDAFYGDLREDDVRSVLSLVHSRFSTNTFPTWERAHPYRRIAHNGEINTLRGNQNWMSAREPMLASKVFGEHLGDFKPIIRPGGSDSASLDNVVDFLLAAGRSLPHVMMMLVPEAWSTQADMGEAKRGFYEYHAGLVEPWDGPAALMFTDGTLVGATLDRNGLRPAKYVVTKDLVCVASELGVLDFEPSEVLAKGRLQPGKMFLVDTAAGVVVDDDEIKRGVCGRHPYARWVEENKIDLSKIPDVASLYSVDGEQRHRLRRAFGYTREDLRVVLAPMARQGEEPVGSMGNDAPLAVLSERPVSLFRYFKQQFAQVTNPPIDPIREDLVMSLVCSVGGEGNLLDETPRQARLLELPHPILSSAELAKLRKNPYYDFRAAVLDAVFRAPAAKAPAPEGLEPILDPWAPAAEDYDPAQALREALDDLCAKASAAIADGHSILVVSDRAVDAEHAPIPSLLATAAVHHHLCRRGERARAGLVVESGEPREVADFALLLGYGAGAVNPYLAFDTLTEMAGDGRLGEVDHAAASKSYVKALCKGLLKVMSKMGISTLASYQGAQIFEAIGIGESVIERYFTGTASPIGGIGLREIALEALARHAAAFDGDADLDDAGVYAWRARGERHLWDPSTVASLQKAVRLDDAASYAEYSRRIHDPAGRPVTLRALWDFVPRQPPVALGEVEPAATIVRRFATGAMSFGSISKEAHENLAVAMNRIGGKSNTGEGGEDEARFVPDARGDLRRSAIKQVASARFGVTTTYLVNADELQIKMAQGAKPGEGGQLPGHKVDEVIARVRHATPGVTLISPPPHHDIYSIEDLAQLIFDLKAVAPSASVSVKLVAETGVGTVAAGVVKAGADAVLVAGHDGGTGASPLSSIQHAGSPWEIGLAEAHQVLVLNGLRERARLQADGQMKTGRDVAIAALLGADEMGFATAPLVASGCVMMRKCHLNTCPVGIATQDPVLRARFRGAPEHVIRYFFFVAEELRGIMAQLGFRTMNEMVGRADCLAVRKGIRHPKALTLDFSRVLEVARGEGPGIVSRRPQPGNVDEQLVLLTRKAIDRGEPVWIATGIGNVDRAFGARVAGEVARAHGTAGLADDTIRVDATGTAGQSFGAFATRGMTLGLEGDANDYVGKGLSGGVLAIRPPRSSTFRAHDNVIVGNTVLYGATSGRCFVAGRAGERFAVRNSGAIAVVEGVGDHGCEYMTGGAVLVLGTTGRNFGAGMSGGFAYVLDEDGRFASRVNAGMVSLEPVSARDDVEGVRALLEEHVARTASARGGDLLARFGWTCGKLVKVVPTEYAKALEAARARAAASAEQHAEPAADAPEAARG